MPIARITACILFLLAFNCKAQSFDCAKASTLAEKTICDSSELGRSDEMLSRTYKLVLSESANPARLQADQRAWVAKRNACKDSEDCLEAIYGTRTKALEAAWTLRRNELANSQKPPSVTKPFEGGWYSCALWKGNEVCAGYRLLQSGKQICGEWDYWATNRMYEGQLQATTISANRLELKLICGTPGSETSTECVGDSKTMDGWEATKGGLLVCLNALSVNPDKSCGSLGDLQPDYRYRPLTRKELDRLKSEAWVQNCLAGKPPSVR